MNSMNDSYTTIKERSEGSFYDRKSRFIGIAFPAYSEAEIKEMLSKVRKDYYDAVHHCYAWSIFDGKNTFRYSDDGEPNGSAGIHIYNQIQNKEISNIFVVVVRYYGGIKLGVPGLINAYRTAAAEALNNSEKINAFVEVPVKVQFPYAVSADMMRIEKKYTLSRIGEEYTAEQSIIQWKVRLSQVEELKDAFLNFEGVQFINTEEK